MDTGSHLLFGATLAGLAYLDPAVAAQPELAQAVLIGTMIGSHAPDFDTVTRLKSFNHYMRYHRGISHSIPALFIWPAVIALPLSWAFGLWDAFSSLYFWTMLAAMLHVMLDLFNVYGVQCLRPINRKWHRFDILALFDPFLFILHLSGLLVWLTVDVPPNRLFPGIYLGTFIYIGIRGLLHYAMVRRVKASFFPLTGICHVIPGLHWFRWQFVLETDDYFYTGNIRYGKIILLDTYPKDSRHPAVQATLGTDGVRAFLNFAQRVHVKILASPDGYEVEWRDVRFWYNHRLPFGVDVKLDRNMNVLRERLGWKKKAWDPPYV